MNLTTKYGVGDVVYAIQPASRDYVETGCTLCVGVGYVQIQGSARRADCPDCHYGKIGDWVDLNPAPLLLTIGQVRVETENMTDRGAKKVHYMCRETGIGSGTVWREDQLHESREAAEFAIAGLTA